MSVWETRDLFGEVSEAAGFRIWVVRACLEGEVSTPTPRHALVKFQDSGVETTMPASRKRTKTGHQGGIANRARCPGDPSTATSEGGKRESMGFRIPKHNGFRLELCTQAKEGGIKIFSDTPRKFASHVL